ncbi:hypothetical protein [Sphingobacterium hungaricum]|uniref:Addiction module component n=1 Tax=Sphingobacterium hungaricum TaxID=2082723 RepID=A0A928UV34_9SPHI|nr:hypothetical protein [Sphingobacterium hungaricum]MBE8713755.1 hypothetical protein [Sphingobacterium hungaricum]
MTFDDRKILLIEEFLKIDDQDVIKALEILIEQNKVTRYEENLKPMSISELNEEIDMGIKDEQENKLISVRDLKEQVKKF